MSGSLYDDGIDDIGKADLDLVNADIRALLLDEDYVFDAAHKYLDDVAAGARLDTAVALTGKTFSGGVFDADDVVFSAVAAGDEATAVLLYVHTGTDATSRLLYWTDAISGFPWPTNGQDITVRWPGGAGKIFHFRVFRPTS